MYYTRFSRKARVCRFRGSANGNQRSRGRVADLRNPFPDQHWPSSGFRNPRAGGATPSGNIECKAAKACEGLAPTHLTAARTRSRTAAKKERCENTSKGKEFFRRDGRTREPGRAIKRFDIIGLLERIADENGPVMGTGRRPSPAQA